MRYLKTYTLFERISKETKLFESNDKTEEMIKDFLRDFSDNDIPVEVEMYKPDPLNSEEERALILIGSEGNESERHIFTNIVPLYDNLQSIISLNDYLDDNGFEFVNVDCWIKNDDTLESEEPKSIRFDNFDDFIKKVEDINFGNLEFVKLNKERPRDKWFGYPFGTDFKIKNDSGVVIGKYEEFPKTFRLVDIYYTTKKSNI
jgi:hypothetical protein